MENSLELMELYYNRMNNCESTSGRSKNFKKMLELWETSPAVRKVWDYVESAFLIVKRFVKKLADKFIPTPSSDSIVFNTPIYGDGVEQLYFIRLLDENGSLVWSKIGTTSRQTDKRMKEHFRYYKKSGIAKIVVDEVFNCGDYHAEMFEDLFRAHYMRKFSKGTWKKNDRFAGVELDLDEARALFEKWAA